MLLHYLVKQAINDKLRDSVATYLRCGGVVNNQIKKGSLLSPQVRVKKWLKSMNIWQSYKQERGCLVHFARLANTPLKDEESTRDNHVLAWVSHNIWGKSPGHGLRKTEPKCDLFVVTNRDDNAAMHSPCTDFDF